jgi:hypothetical protein
MPDRLYLSYWLRGFDALTMLGAFEKMLRAFPFSRRASASSVLRVHAIELGEPAVLERAFEAPPDVSELIAAAREFQREDNAYQVDGWWDLWRFDRDWELSPARVSLACFGPEVESPNRENLLVDFGLDSDFLPQPQLPGGVRLIQSNIRSLLRLTRELDRLLPAGRRQLWSESGENFAERLQAALTELR